MIPVNRNGSVQLTSVDDGGDVVETTDDVSAEPIYSVNGSDQFGMSPQLAALLQQRDALAQELQAIEAQTQALVQANPGLSSQIQNARYAAQYSPRYQPQYAQPLYQGRPASILGGGVQGRPASILQGRGSLYGGAQARPASILGSRGGAPGYRTMPLQRGVPVHRGGTANSGVASVLGAIRAGQGAAGAINRITGGIFGGRNGGIGTGDPDGSITAAESRRLGNYGAIDGDPDGSITAAESRRLGNYGAIDGDPDGSITAAESRRLGNYPAPTFDDDSAPGETSGDSTFDYSRDGMPSGDSVDTSDDYDYSDDLW